MLNFGMAQIKQAPIPFSFVLRLPIYSPRTDKIGARFMRAMLQIECSVNYHYDPFVRLPAWRERHQTFCPTEGKLEFIVCPTRLYLCACGPPCLLVKIVKKGRNQRCITFTMSKSNLPQTETKATENHFKYV